MAIQPSFTWSKLRGRGSINKTGLYIATARARGTAVIWSKAEAKVGKATITIVPNAAGAIRKIKKASTR
jgi:hypothetical protein